MIDKRLTYDLTMYELLGSRNEVRELAVPEWHARILEGLPMGALETIKERAGLTDVEISRLLGIGEATLRRARAAGAPLSPEISDRLYRLAKSMAVATEVLQSNARAMSWLRREQPGLKGAVPLDLLVTHAGADEVETVLRRIEYGVYT